MYYDKQLGKYHDTRWYEFNVSIMIAMMKVFWLVLMIMIDHLFIMKMGEDMSIMPKDDLY